MSRAHAHKLLGQEPGIYMQMQLQLWQLGKSKSACAKGCWVKLSWSQRSGVRFCMANATSCICAAVPSNIGDLHTLDTLSSLALTRETSISVLCYWAEHPMQALRVAQLAVDCRLHTEDIGNIWPRGGRGERRGRPGSSFHLSFSMAPPMPQAWPVPT